MVIKSSSFDIVELMKSLKKKTGELVNLMESTDTTWYLFVKEIYNDSQDDDLVLVILPDNQMSPTKLRRLYKEYDYVSLMEFSIEDYEKLKRTMGIERMIKRILKNLIDNLEPIDKLDKDWWYSWD